MNQDFSGISIEDILRDPDLIDRATRDARRFRAREMQRMLGAAWRRLTELFRSAKTAPRTAPCG
jgi:hypothetical protein